MSSKVLKLDPRDNVFVALTPLAAKEAVAFEGRTYTLPTNVPAKFKFLDRDTPAGAEVVMYGVVVGRVREALAAGSVLTTQNLQHDSSEYSLRESSYEWLAPDVSRWMDRSFLGYHRIDGQVGTRNYWLVVPLVFCENRNVEMLQDAFEQELGYRTPNQYRQHVRELLRRRNTSGLQNALAPMSISDDSSRPFPNVDGIKFLVHEGGCGGTREDARALCGLLAGYIHNPNVAGATVLSLGCQNAQVSMLHDELQRRDPHQSKPVLVMEHQAEGLGSTMLSRAIAETFAGLEEANMLRRTPAPLSALTIGLKCGGSDGFSGISANPAVGHVSDLLTALGGRSILAEFPELCGVEQSLIDRSATPHVAERFVALMTAYAARAKAVRSGFDMNPSPGNIRDGLITDAMKSAGAARKSGTSPVIDVLDYPEYVTDDGLNLLCTPGNDVECVTAQVGAGANMVLFTTGLGTPTGNPIAPVIKISTNSPLALRMSDLIDIDTGGIISGEMTVEQAGNSILEFAIEVASGRVLTKAELAGQDDFIPWKRGVSL